MPVKIIIRLVLWALTLFTVGGIVGALIGRFFGPGPQLLTPFFVLSVAALIAAVGYTASVLKKSGHPPKGN